MPTTNYIRLGDRIVGERTDGGTRTNYATDAAGSVVGTIVDQQLQNTYAYKPYGTILSKTGGSPDPAFKWNGSLGYRQTNQSYSDTYVRARHYSTQTSRWTTVDPKFPGEPAFAYVAGRPTSQQDPSGRGTTSLILDAGVTALSVAECTWFGVIYCKIQCKKQGQAFAGCSLRISPIRLECTCQPPHDFFTWVLEVLFIGAA